MFRFPLPDEPIFGKSKKKNSESLVKKQLLQFTSTRSCLITTNCLKLSSRLRFCSLFRFGSPVPVIPSDYERKDHVIKLSYWHSEPFMCSFLFFCPTDRPNFTRGNAMGNETFYCDGLTAVKHVFLFVSFTSFEE